jgi:hypothetical protein
LGKFIAGKNYSSNDLLPVTMTPVKIFCLCRCPVATKHHKTTLKNHYMSVNCNPTAFHQNMKKPPVSKLF